MANKAHKNVKMQNQVAILKSLSVLLNQAHKSNSLKTIIAIGRLIS